MPAVLEAVIPVFIVASLGYAVRRRFPLDSKTLSTLNIYVFIPALVFANLSTQSLEWGVFGKIALGSVIVTAATTLLLTAIARFRGMSPSMTSAFLLSMFPNLGNFGLPVCMFAFGVTGLAIAVVVMVCGSLIQNSLGVFFALRSRNGAASSFVRVLAFPVLYAFLAALVVQRMGWTVPDTVFRPIDLVADAAIPVQLMLLGAKVAESRLFMNADMALAIGARLLAGPAIAMGIAFALGMEGLVANVFIVQMSGPIAVGMAVYGVQFDVEPGYLAAAVSWSFLFSLVTVSVVLWIVM